MRQFTLSATTPSAFTVPLPVFFMFKSVHLPLTKISPFPVSISTAKVVASTLSILIEPLSTNLNFTFGAGATLFTWRVLSPRFSALCKNAEYTVIKNNITKRALAEAGIEGLEDKLVGPTAVIMSNEDYLEPSKAIYEFTKNNDYYKIKGGVIEGKVMSAEEIITLAKLPSKETLLSMLAGALLANIQKFAVAVDQVRIQKENSASESTAEAEA